MWNLHILGGVDKKNKYAKHLILVNDKYIGGNEAG